MKCMLRSDGKALFKRHRRQCPYSARWMRMRLQCTWPRGWQAARHWPATFACTVCHRQGVVPLCSATRCSCRLCPETAALGFRRRGASDQCCLWSGKPTSPPAGGAHEVHAPFGWEGITLYRHVLASCRPKWARVQSCGEYCSAAATCSSHVGIDLLRCLLPPGVLQAEVAGVR